MVCVRWRPFCQHSPASVSGSSSSHFAAWWKKLLPLLPRTYDKNLTQSFDVLKSLSEGCLPGCFLLLRVSLKLLTHSSTVLRLETSSFRWILKCWRNIRWVTTESLCLKYVIHLHSESPMLYRPTLHGNWDALSLARRILAGKFPTRQRFHLQLCCQIVRYFCRTLYIVHWLFLHQLRAVNSHTL
jgi:hypothetical protein